MSDIPEVRSAHMKAILEFIHSLPEPFPDEIMKRVKPGTMQEIKDSLKTRWLPAVTDKEVTEAVWQSMTDERYYKFWVDYGLSTLDNPFLRQAFNAARRLFGLTTARLITWTPRAFHGYYRNCGDLIVGDHSDNYCNLIQKDFPAELAASLPYIRGFAYCYAAIFPLTKIEGRVSIHDYNPEEGSVRFLYEW
jgi:hypothetical protein